MRSLLERFLDEVEHEEERLRRSPDAGEAAPEESAAAVPGDAARSPEGTSEA
jgi:hypothetical protein